LGFEIIDDGDSGIISKDFFDISEAKINNFIKRMDNNITECLETLSTSLKNRSLKKQDYEEIETTDRDTTRFYLLISRLFFKGVNNPSVLNALKKDAFSFFNDWWFSQNLEHIGDVIKEIALLFYRSHTRKSNMEELSDIFSEIFDCYKVSIEAIGNRNRENAILCAKKGKEIGTKCDVLARHNNNSTAKLAIKFKELENSIYQNLKIIIYLRENDRTN